MERLSRLFYVMILVFVACGCDFGPRVGPPIDKIDVVHPLSDADVNTVVVEEVAQQLGLAEDAVKPENVFMAQTNPGDALDIVEATMAIEERLGIAINDDEIDRAAKSRGLTDTPNKLKVSVFQSVVRRTYREKYPSRK